MATPFDLFEQLRPSNSPPQNQPAANEQVIQVADCSCLWIAKNDNSISCLRFYSDGVVISVPSTGSPALIARWFKKPYDTWGRYHITGSSIKFYLMDYDNTFEYDGTIQGSSMQLNLFMPDKNYRAAKRFELVDFAATDNTDETAAPPEKKAPAKAAPPELHLSVHAIAVAPKFPAYLGGGANITPPDAIAAATPVASSSKGPTFSSGQVSSSTNLIKLTVTVTNPAQEEAYFKFGDVQLALGPYLFEDFAAVGYDSNLCAMSPSDRKKVKERYVTVPPAGKSVLSFAFPFLDPAAKRAVFILGMATPILFAIPGPPVDKAGGEGSPSVAASLFSRVAGWLGRKQPS